MIDWAIVGKVAGGGYGITILVLVILSLAAWIQGLIIQKTAKTNTKGQEEHQKG